MIQNTIDGINKIREKYHTIDNKEAILILLIEQLKEIGERLNEFSNKE